MVTRGEAEAVLRNAGWLNRTETQQLLGVLGGPAGKTRAVGGIVRDTILGRDRGNNDIDLATELLPDEVMRRAGVAGISAHPTGIEHGTVTLKLGELLAEVTTLREDVETDGRRAAVKFGTGWTRDAERRDFTLNALYAGMDGVLFDPLGGFEDCLAGRVRFIGDPDQRIAEDRLRVYRFFRFSASHGGQRFDPGGLTACRLAADRLGRLSAERVGAEMRRMLALENVALTLQTMEVSGVLSLGAEALRLLTSYEQRADPPTATGRLAIIIGASEGKAVQKRWRLSNGEIKAAEEILAAQHLLAADRVNEAAYRYGGALPDAIAVAAITLHWTDDHIAGLRAGTARLSIPKFPLAGGDLIRLGYKPGKALGQELARLETTWIESGFALDRRALLASASAP